jgi:cellulose synthase/poly-beta-1,6-N-acetylglucosamine synthase-like glycosyltransferase
VTGISEAFAAALLGVEWVAFAFFLGINGFYAALLLSASAEMIRHRRLSKDESRWRVLASPLAPSISIIAPAHNEEATIAESLRALFGLHYPNLEIVVVNDGSKDRTLDVLRETFELVPIHPIYRRLIPTRAVRGLYRSGTYPSLVVVDKENGRKADAINAGLNVATGELVCVIDADTLIEPDALQRMVRPFLNSSAVLAAGGTIRIANGSVVRGGRVVEPRVPRHPLAAFQVVEYLRAFLFGRLGWNRLGDNLIISGAFGLFRRESLLAAGGFAHDTVGEDMELVLRLRTRACELGGPRRIAFVPDPVAWTEAPERLQTLGSQRERWHRGLTDVLWRYRRVFLNPRYGVMGMVVFPYFALFELLAPVVEAVGLIGMALGLAFGVLNLPFALLFILMAYGLAAALTVFTFMLEEFTFHRYARMRDRLGLVFWSTLEGVGYRQLTVIWRLRGIVRYLRGRSDWGSMTRRGFQAGAAAAAPVPAVRAGGRTS